MADTLITITGLAEVLANLQRAVEGLAQLAPAALDAEAQRILAQSQSLVPVDTGALRASAAVTPAVIAGTDITIALSYDTPYAVRQHEDTSLHHPTGGQSHYLSMPFFAATDGMLERLAAVLTAHQGVTP